MHWRQFWTLTSGRVVRISARIVFLRGGERSWGARGTNEDNWSSRWRFADYRLLATARAIRPARFHEEPSPGGGRVLGNVPNALPATGPPRRPPHAGRGNFHTIHSWPDDEEEQRQQHSYRDRSNVYAILPVAPQIAAADCVGKKDWLERSRRRRDERPNDGALSRNLASVPRARREALSDAARVPSASGSNSIFGAS